MDLGKPGSDWTDNQNDLIVADYFTMLAAEIAGKAYIKSHHNTALQSLTGRPRGSIERKHMNISAVMERLGLPRIKGYVPYPNFQSSLLNAVERYLIRVGLPDFPVNQNASDELKEHRALWIGPPPTVSEDERHTPPELERLVRKFDPAARDANNRSLGMLGEQLVFESEVNRLAASNRLDLAKKVEWTSQERGDGAGFDIASFEIDGRERLIEVKTTKGSALTPFYLSENERQFSEERPEAFKLLRVYEFSNSPKAFELCPPLHSALNLNPINYRAMIA